MVKSSDNQNNFFSPFISITPHITNIAATILFLLLLQVGMLFITKSYLSLFVIASSTLATFAAGLVIKFYANDESFSFLLSTIQGLLIGMLLPESFPILSVFFITFLVFVISHYKVPKASASWLNEVLLVVCISWIVGQNSFPEMHATLEVLQAKNPSLFLIEDGVLPIADFDGPVTNALNNAFFSVLNMSVPEGYISLLWDTGSSIPAFRFNLLTLASSIILFSFDMMKMTIPVIFLLVYSLLVRFLSPVMAGGFLGQGDVILCIFTGGTLFCAVFFIQWFGTVPITSLGKIVYGGLCAFLAFFIAGCGTSPSGMVFSILCANLISPVIQFFENELYKKHLRIALENVKNEVI